MIDLAAARRAAGVTQAAVAARLGVTQGRVSQIESAPDPRWTTVTGYLRALGLALEIRPAPAGG